MVSRLHFVREIVSKRFSWEPLSKETTGTTFLQGLYHVVHDVLLYYFDNMTWGIHSQKIFSVLISIATVMNLSIISEVVAHRCSG